MRGILPGHWHCVFLATLAVPAGQWKTLFHPKMFINISQQIEEGRRKTEEKKDKHRRNEGEREGGREGGKEKIACISRCIS